MRGELAQRELDEINRALRSGIVRLQGKVGFGHSVCAGVGLSEGLFQGGTGTHVLCCEVMDKADEGRCG